MARRVRDPQVPLGQRASAFRSLLNRHAPFGFEATEEQLCALVGATRRGGGGFWSHRPRDWTGKQLLAALDALEESRASHLRYAAAFAERRRREKALHRRQPTRSDLQALRRAEWLKDSDEATRRQSSTREVRRARVTPKSE